MMKVSFEFAYILLCLTDLRSCIGRLVAESCPVITTMSFLQNCSITRPKVGSPLRKNTLQMSSRR